MIYRVLLIISFLISSDSKLLLYDMYNEDGWIEINRTNDNKIIYESKQNHSGDKYIKIIKKIEYSVSDIFNQVKSISNYNQIISNKNVYTKLVFQNKDTLYAFQRISNSIPFVRDRQYIFKMYHVGDLRIDWYIIDESSPILKEYITDSRHTLTYGAGSWNVEENNLINRIYVDDEVNLPFRFLQKIRTGHVTAIFDDVLKSTEKRRKK